ncbi:hypothetical protein [Hyphomicrobium sp.]|uniref:hypothetical protein n=1 Tax=Hyphomicrobium sp. TaxID=82 RepID=UPI001D9B5146|nr:hypothetical protein [Hyphomicrobium sp.]MBY0559667.1 hypothetical protein [Hyphomicrobium sp.]
MTSRVDAVILALQSVLADAERRRDMYWQTRTINRWVNQLPGAWTWKWRHLKLRGDSRRVNREDAIVHLRATIAYLEANRANIERQPFRWPHWRKSKMPLPIEPRKPEIKIVEGPTSNTRH